MVESAVAADLVSY